MANLGDRIIAYKVSIIPIEAQVSKVDHRGNIEEITTVEIFGNENVFAPVKMKDSDRRKMMKGLTIFEV